MYFVKNLVVFVTAAAVVSAMPGMDRRMLPKGIIMRDTSCADHIGDCSVNGCQPIFHHPDDVSGYCTAGTFRKCPCNKCSSEEVFCADDACSGQDGTCTTNRYQGCPCAPTLEITVS